MFVAGGGGVGLFPASSTENVVEPSVVFVPITDPTPTVEIVLGWDRDSLNPLVPAVVEIAAEGVAVRSSG